MSKRDLSLPKSVAASGSVEGWNSQSKDLGTLIRMLHDMCDATTVPEALDQVRAVASLGHNLWAYAYMRMLYSKNLNLYYATLLAEPDLLLPVVYTPTVGEACQKFGKMPFSARGCYVSIKDRGNIKQVLEEYAAAELSNGPDGKPLCDCIVFSDAGRILGLGDLGTWGMGIPIGKLDLYTVCAGVNPHRTMPVIIDAGCSGAEGNTDKVVVRDHPLYTGLKHHRVMHKSEAGTEVNSAYYGKGNMIEEFMQAAVDIFGKQCLLQFEDFNSNDAFPLIAEYRDKFLTYNDDIQGTASVAVAALMGAIKLRNPTCSDLIAELKKETFLFHGAGSANLGTLSLLSKEVGVPRQKLFVTNSAGVIWRSEDGSQGNFRNSEQKEFAQVKKPAFDIKDLPTVISTLQATVIIGAVGRDPGCFNKKVVDTLVETAKSTRPIIFALSNPKTQAEITATDAYAWSGGKAIYGSDTAMDDVVVDGQLRSPGQVNNIYIFPGMSMGAICCKARNIPERIFLVAAEAVANSLDAEDLKADRVVPSGKRIREVGFNVAVAVVLECQRLGLAAETLGANRAEVEMSIKSKMWSPCADSGGYEDPVVLVKEGVDPAQQICSRY
ncbi:unnamed protein product [Polarella glacialis]|uniref:Malic enzyme n=1 Tax=Polarella glacialis TaxID=89957 RepID=A0A813D342_POLGL|nr:unnamed protein product [Polarella glacialis]